MLKDIILVSIAVLSFLGMIFKAVLGTPKSVMDVAVDMQEIREKIGAINSNLSAIASNIEELHRQNKAMWEKIDILSETAMRHNSEISYLRGLVNNRTSAYKKEQL